MLRYLYIGRHNNVAKHARVHNTFVNKDHLYASLQVTRMLSAIMRKGKGQKAERFIYHVLRRVKFYLKKNPEIFMCVLILLANTSIYVREIKKAKKMYTVPFFVSHINHRDTLTRSLLFKSIRAAHSDKSIVDAITNELYAFIYNSVSSNMFRRLTNIFAAAIENRVFIHYRW